MKIHLGALGAIKSEAQNPPFRIENLRWDDDLYGLNNSVIARFDLVADEFRIKEFLFMENFRQFLRWDFPEIAGKFSKLRGYIGGFGTKHRQMVDILTDSGFDFEFYIHKIMNDYLDLREEHEMQSGPDFHTFWYEPRRMRVSSDGEAYDPDADDRESNHKWVYFCEELTELIEKTATKMYPEILMKEPAEYREWVKKIEGAVADIAHFTTG